MYVVLPTVPGVRSTGLYTVVLSQGCCQCTKITTRSLHHTFYTGTNQSCTGIPGTPVPTFLLQCQPPPPALTLCLSMAQTTTCLF